MELLEYKKLSPLWNQLREHVTHGCRPAAYLYAAQQLSFGFIASLLSVLGEGIDRLITGGWSKTRLTTWNSLYCYGIEYEGNSTDAWLLKLIICRVGTWWLLGKYLAAEHHSCAYDAIRFDIMAQASLPTILCRSGPSSMGTVWFARIVASLSMALWGYTGPFHLPLARLHIDCLSVAKRHS